MNEDEKFIDIAIELSKKADYPYGAIIVRNGEIIGRSDVNVPVSKTEFSHAELRAIENAIDHLGGHLCAEGGKDCVIYSSCEPCAMCMGAILYTGISKLVYAATLEDSKECVNEILAKAQNVADSCKNRKIELVAELHRDKAVEILKGREKTEIQKKFSNIFILHSLNGDTLKMWGQDIKDTYEKKDLKVFMPEFPIRAESKYDKFKVILKEYIDNGTLNNDSIVIAHSIGNAYFVRFCMELDYVPKAYIAVAPGACYEYPSSRNDYIIEVKKQSYLNNDSLEYVKKMNSIKYCLYSDEDDKNLEKFTRFIKDTNSEGIYLKYYNHFDGYHRIYKIPELNEIIDRLLLI